MTEYLRTIAAYLTGWLIVQPLYNRLYRAWRRQHLDQPTAEDRLYFAQVAGMLREGLFPLPVDTIVQLEEGVIHWRGETYRRDGRPGVKVYPYRDGPAMVLGPGVIVNAPGARPRVINWLGENFYQERT